MSKPPSLAEWQAALAAADVPPEGVTTQELAVIFEKSVGWVQKHLRRLHVEGKVAHVGWRTVPRLDGQMSKVPVYRLKGKK